MMKMMWWVFVFCSIAMGQDCPPSLPNEMDVIRTIEGSYTHTLGSTIRDTRQIDVDYVDNRHDIIDQFVSFGGVDITNLTDVRRRIRYRFRVPVPPHISDIITTRHEEQSAEMFEICVDETDVVLLIQVIIDANDSRSFTWDFTVNLTRSTGDSDGNGEIDRDDVLYLIDKYGNSDPVVDMDGNGIVDNKDLAMVLNGYQITYQEPEEPEEPEDTELQDLAIDHIRYTISELPDISNYPNENILISLDDVSSQNVKGELEIATGSPEVGGGTPAFGWYTQAGGFTAYWIAFGEGGSLLWKQNNPNIKWIIEVVRDGEVVYRTSTDGSILKEPDGRSIDDDAPYEYPNEMYTPNKWNINDQINIFTVPSNTETVDIVLE